MTTEVILTGLGILVAAIGYLLAKRDDKRQDEIKANQDSIEKLRLEHQSELNELFRLRAQDVQALSDYKLKVSETHYPKGELDMRFAQLNATMEKGFNQIGEDIRGMTKALTEHIHEAH